MDQLTAILDLLRNAIEQGQTIKIEASDVTINASEIVINGLEINTAS